MEAVMYRVLVGDNRETLKTLVDGSVHCCVTSPPYWGLRDYGHADQLGLEKTPEEYVANMVAVFREVRRVLRDDGTLWLNLGDSYCSTDKWGGGGSNTGKQTINWTHADAKCDHDPEYDECSSFSAECVRCVKCNGSGRVESWKVRERKQAIDGIKPKDLVGIPWRVAFALQADGWYLRSDIIWAKPNPMPESVMDRPTKAHEYLFLLTKSPRYFYDAEAIKESGTNRPCGNTRPTKAALNGDDKQRTTANLHNIEAAASRNRRSVWTVAEDELEQFRQWKAAQERHKPDVWNVATATYSEAHFATYPPKLIEPCIKAGTSERGCCPVCGSQWERVVEKTSVEPVDYCGKHSNADPQSSGRRMLANVRARRNAGNEHDNPFPSATTTSWRPACSHEAEPVPCTVLDTFGGSGTTAGVANALGRHAILCELSDDYAALMPDRVRSIVDAYFGRDKIQSVKPAAGQRELFDGE